MAATYEQVPGKLGLRFRKGDKLSTEVDFSPLSLTGFTVSATLTSLVSGVTVAPIITTMVDAADGRVNIEVPEANAAALPVGTYRWDMTATDGSRRSYLTGFVEVVS